MVTTSFTETFEKLMALEASSLKRIQDLHARVRQVRVDLEAEIEAANSFLEECEDL